MNTRTPHRTRLFNGSLFSACALAVVLIGCGGGGAGNSPASIVSGKAYHEVQGGPCCYPPTDTPLASTYLSFHRSSGIAYSIRVRTDSAGNYSASLPAGIYSVDIADLSSGVSYNAVTPQQFTVMPPSPIQMEVKFIQDVP